MLKEYVAKDLKIIQDSFFETKEFYKIVTKWFELNNYNFHEKEYQDIDEPIGKRVEIYWVAEKQIDEYVKFGMEISVFFLGINKAEVEKGGVKMKTDKSTLTVQFNAYLMKDYDDSWSNTAMKKNMRELYDRFIIRKRLERLQTELANELNSLIDEMRSFLEMHKF